MKVDQFPKEILEKMLERQVEQGNEKSIEIFLNNRRSAGRKIGGFTWSETVEGHVFWNEVIQYENFDLFYRKYPKPKQLSLF